MQGISISVSWAISQYRQALAVLGTRTRNTIQAIRAPSEPPEVVSYWRSIGIGRHIDAYA